MSLLKKLLVIFCAFGIMFVSKDMSVAASTEREVIEALLYVKNSRLVLKDYDNLAIAKEDTKIYNDEGVIIGILKKDAAAEIVDLINTEAKYEIISGGIKGFVKMETLLVEKEAEFRAVAVLEEKAAADSKKLVFEKKEIVYGNQKKEVSFEVIMDGVLDKAEPTDTTLEDEEVALSDTVKEDGQPKEEVKKAKVKKAEAKKEKTEINLSKRKIKYSNKDLDLLAAIVYCEVGNQPFQGKLAVANVILNRVESSLFPNSIKGVIYARRQFSPARNGRLDKALRNGVPKSCYEASRAALDGNNNVKGYFYFDGRPHKGGYKKIGVGYFWKTPW